MPRLIATKRFDYMSRQLRAGDPFEARPQDVRVLLAIRKARMADDAVAETRAAPAAATPRPEQVAAPRPAVAAAEPRPAPVRVGTADEGDTDALRAEAEALGIEVDRRWRQARLRHEIEQARRG